MTKKKASAIAVIQHGQGDAVKSEAALEKLADLVARRLSQNPESPKRLEEMNAEELTGEVLMQPWFLSREISFAILRLLPLPHREKWSWMFSDWGCQKCGRKDAIHASNGFCRNCYMLVRNRLQSSIVRHTVNGPTARQLTAALTEKADRAARVLDAAGLRDPETQLRDRIDPVQRATRVLSAVPIPQRHPGTRAHNLPLIRGKKEALKLALNKTRGHKHGRATQSSEVSQQTSRVAPGTGNRDAGKAPGATISGEGT